MSVHILANNALREHHASAPFGVSANDLSDIGLLFEIILLSCLKYSLVIVRKISECFGRVSNLKKLALIE